MPHLPITLTVLLVVLLPVPAKAQICTPFIDVPAASGFCSNIQWLFNRGVTLGCTSNQFCPADPVRRDQMAAFLNRLADDLFPLTCAPGQVMKWNGLAWACANDALGTGAANAFLQGGNSFAAPAVIGTADNQSLDVIVNNRRVMRFEPNASGPNVIGGDPSNYVAAGVHSATIGGGGAGLFGPVPNWVTDHYGTVAGGWLNLAGNDAGTLGDAGSASVGGGFGNIAGGAFSTVAGGNQNKAGGEYSTIGGGDDNRADGLASTIGGGRLNRATLEGGTVGGGQDNLALGSYSTVAGGVGNTTNGAQGTIGGGLSNEANGPNATVAGGSNNNASGNGSAIAGGLGNSATGGQSFVGGGVDNDAAGTYSVALGRRAKALFDGDFVFADSSNFDFAPNGPDNFRVRATGGVRFVVGINPSTGTTTWSCGLVDGDPGWVCTSDRNQKQDLQRLDGEAVLEKLAAMPVYAWSPKGVNSHVRHYGPTAQDFHAAFGLGDTDLGIGQQDADGVALAAIQGLNAKLETKLAERDAEMALMRAELAELRSVRAELAAILAMMADRTALAVEQLPELD